MNVCTLHKTCETRALDLYEGQIDLDKALACTEDTCNVRHALDLCEKGGGHLNFVRRQITELGDLHLTF